MYFTTQDILNDTTLGIPNKSLNEVILTISDFNFEEENNKVHTQYDETRYEVREKLTECLDKARALLNENALGYNEMKPNYAIDLYVAIKNVRDMV